MFLYGITRDSIEKKKAKKQKKQKANEKPTDETLGMAQKE